MHLLRDNGLAMSILMFFRMSFQVTEATATGFRAEILLHATLSHPNVVAFIGTSSAAMRILLRPTTAGNAVGVLSLASPPSSFVFLTAFSIYLFIL